MVGVLVIRLVLRVITVCVIMVRVVELIIVEVCVLDAPIIAICVCIFVIALSNGVTVIG